MCTFWKKMRLSIMVLVSLGLFSVFHSSWAGDMGGGIWKLWVGAIEHITTTAHRTVKNNCSYAIMIPYKTAAEWNAFKTNKPACVDIINPTITNNTSSPYATCYFVIQGMWPDAYSCGQALGACRSPKTDYSSFSSHVGTPWDGWWYTASTDTWTFYQTVTFWPKNWYSIGAADTDGTLLAVADVYCGYNW